MAQQVNQPNVGNQKNQNQDSQKQPGQFNQQQKNLKQGGKSPDSSFGNTQWGLQSGKEFWRQQENTRPALE